MNAAPPLHGTVQALDRWLARATGESGPPTPASALLAGAMATPEARRRTGEADLPAGISTAGSGPAVQPIDEGA